MTVSQVRTNMFKTPSENHRRESEALKSTLIHKNLSNFGQRRQAPNIEPQEYGGQWLAVARNCRFRQFRIAEYLAWLMGGDG